MDPTKTTRTWRAGELALVVLALLAVIGAAHAAQDFLVPLVAGILIAYALKPLVSALERLRVPRVFGAALMLVAMSIALAGAIVWVKGDAAAALAELPEAARQLRMAAHESASAPKNPIGHVREFVSELNRAAAEALGAAPAGTGKPPPAIEPSVSSELQAWGTAQSSKFLSVVFDLAIAALVALFVLASGDTFRRKLVHWVGPTLAARRVTVEILDEIDGQVQRYLLVILITNTLVALAIYLLMTTLGVERPALWAVIAGVLHLIPYVGTAITSAAIGVAAFLQFGTLVSAAATGLSALLLSSAIGIGLSAWLQGKANDMDPVAVFVALLFFGWLWGGWGLLLGGPVIAIVKTVAERIPAMRAFGDFLGR
jgi:predicted PurR-regulated permease PerM